MATSHLPPFSIRPRFKKEVPFTSEEVIAKIKHCLLNKEAPCTGKTVRDFAVLTIPESERHYWSPQLTVSLENESEGNGSILRGVYGPAPSVWTMFVFFYAIIGIVILFITIIGGSNYFLGMPSKILWLIPILLLVLASLYFVSYTGQKLGHNQMETLHNFLDNCLSSLSK